MMLQIDLCSDTIRPSEKKVHNTKSHFGAMIIICSALICSPLWAEDAPQYKADSVEYNIQQTALNIEAVLPTKIVNPDYKDAYLDVAKVPKSIRDNFTKRNELYNEINKMKLFGKAKELDTGYLEAVEGTSAEEADKIKKENEYRKELFDLIATDLKLKTKDKAKIPAIYAEVIKYLKDYSVSTTSVSASKNQQTTNVFASMPSIYKYKTVWDAVIKVLSEEKFTIVKRDKEKFSSEGAITVEYKCGTEGRFFVIKLCEIKKKKPVKCKDEAAKDDRLYSSLDEGTMIWVEKGKEKNKDKTLIVDDQNLIKFCTGEDRVFDVLEKLSGLLLNQTSQTQTKKN